MVTFQYGHTVEQSRLQITVDHHTAAISNSYVCAKEDHYRPVGRCLRKQHVEIMWEIRSLGSCIVYSNDCWDPLSCPTMDCYIPKLYTYQMQAVCFQVLQYMVVMPDRWIRIGWILLTFQSVCPPHGQWPAPMGSWRESAAGSIPPHWQVLQYRLVMHDMRIRIRFEPGTDC